ncbi:MAG TPA: CheR family methyltransferase, partial [Gemmatimonadaceae bacterium]|nr:CheR family methyltransferase [Gemmatimonadaceae bacterium]
FRAWNLATDDFPSAASGIGEMDVVLCRNVLIYFDRATVAAVAHRLLASLGEEGWLFLGASDPMLGELVPCETVVTGAGLAYRRLDVALPRPRVWLRRELPEPPEPPTAAAPSAAPAASTAPAAPAAPAASGTAAVEPPPEVTRAPSTPSTPSTRSTPASPAPSEPALAAALAHYAARDYAAAADAARTLVQRDAGLLPAWTLLVRALANAGREADAEQACAAGLERHRDSAELAYLHAVLLAHGGHFAASAAAARRALYLDRTLAVAQLALGAALAREGHGVQARRAYETAERLLAAQPPDAPVPLADGEPARRLLEAARAQQRHLAGAVA